MTNESCLLVLYICTCPRDCDCFLLYAYILSIYISSSLWLLCDGLNTTVCFFKWWCWRPRSSGVIFLSAETCKRNSEISSLQYVIFYLQTDETIAKGHKIQNTSSILSSICATLKESRNITPKIYFEGLFVQSRCASDLSLEHA